MSALAAFLADRVLALRAHQAPPLLVAICGWADTGKSTLARQLCAELNERGQTATAISTDSFMKDRAERQALGLSGYHPAAIDLPGLRTAMLRFVARQAFSVHPYDNRTGTRQSEPQQVTPGEVLVVEGIHALHEQVVALVHLKVFLESDERTLHELRARANLHKRGMQPQDARARIPDEWAQYRLTVQPHAEQADLRVHVDLDFQYRWPHLLPPPGPTL